jgi:cytochrome c oxidase subunit 1
MPRRYYDYLPQFEQLHQISTIGSWILGFGFQVLGIMFLRSLFGGKPSPRNPWGSAQLEWMTPTPPPLYNFVKDPILTRGQYDYHLATDDELYEGYDDPMFPAAAGTGASKSGEGKAQR